MAVHVSVEIKSEARADGTHLVRLVLVKSPHPRARVTLEGFGVARKAWDNAKRRVRPGYALSAEINARISREVERAEAMVIANPHWTPADLKAALRKPVCSTSRSIAEAMREAFDANRHRWRYGTRKGRITVIRDAEAALAGVPLATFGAEHVRALERHYSEMGLASNTRRSRLRRFSTMYLLACELYGLTPAVKPAKYAPSEVRTIKTFLSAEQVERLRAGADMLPSPHQRLAAHSWLLQYDLGGLRFNEVCRLSRSMRHGAAYRWVEGKVPKPRYHPVSAKAEAIIERYAVETRDRVLPLVADGLAGDAFDKAVEVACASVNRALRSVCELLGLPRVTTHNARHSAAQRIKQATDIHTASRILGHATVRQTEAYLNELDVSDIEEAFRRLDKPAN